MAAKVKALQAWCKAMCEGYRDVEIRNMTSSWKDGLAFCALIHRFRPDLIDFDSLSKENVFENNKLAFSVAERELNIPALLDAEDMVAMAVPDKLCIVTYVSQYYNRLGNKEKLGGPGVKGKVATKRPSATQDTEAQSKRPLTVQPDEDQSTSGRRGGTLTDVCAICRQKVYVMERHMEGSRLYHRRCLREQQRSLRSSISPTRREQSPAFPPPSTNPPQSSKAGSSANVGGPTHSTGFANSTATPFQQTKQPTGALVGKENVQPSVITTTERFEPSSPLGQRKGWGENKTGASHLKSNMATVQTGPVSTAPSHNAPKSSPLFTKINSTPKPYSPSVVNTETKSAFSASQNATPTHRDQPEKSQSETSLSTSRPLNANTNKPKFSAKFYGKNPLATKLVKNPAKQQANDTEEQMDTTSGNSERKYDIVGRVINDPASTTPTPTAHAPVSYSPHSAVAGRNFFGDAGSTTVMTAHVTRSPIATAGSTGNEEANVLQGLLKNLAGVRKRNQTPDRSQGRDQQEETAVSDRNKSKEIAPPKPKALENEQPAFTKVQLKPTPPKHSDLPTHKSPPLPSVPPVGRKSGENKPQPKPRQSKLISDPDTRADPQSARVSSYTTRANPDSKREDPKCTSRFHGERDKTPTTHPTQMHVSKLTHEDVNNKKEPSKPVSNNNRMLGVPQAVETPATLDSSGSPKSILKSKGGVPPAVTQTEGTNETLPLYLQKNKAPAWSPPLSVFAPKDTTSGSRLLDTVQLNSSEESSEGSQSKLATHSNAKSREADESNSQSNIQSPSKSHNIQGPNLAKSSPQAQAKSHNTSAQSAKLHNDSSTKVEQKSPYKTDISDIGTKIVTDSSKSSKPLVPEGLDESQEQSDTRLNRPQPKGDTSTNSKPPPLISIITQSPIDKHSKKAEPEKIEVDDTPVPPPRRRSGAPPRPSSLPKIHSNNDQNRHSSVGSPPALPATQAPPRPTVGPSYGGLDIKGLVEQRVVGETEADTRNYLRASVTSDEDPLGRTSKLRSSGGVNRKPAFRIEESPDTSPSLRPKVAANGLLSPSTQNGQSPSGSDADNRPAFVIEAERRKMARNGVYMDLEKPPQHEPQHSPPHQGGPGRRKLIPAEPLTLSYDFESSTRDSMVDSRISPPLIDPDKWNDMQRRPQSSMPTESPPKRRVNAEDRMAVHEIIEQLEHLDAALQILETEGRCLEDKIRLGTDESMDEDELMIQWFELVNQKNELVRKETDLMFKKRQQELEDEHEEIEYALRCLLQRPDHLKTPSERVREESLLQELMDTVSLRNSIVDNIEENRIRYIEEDKEIALVMAMRKFSRSASREVTEDTTPTHLVEERKGGKQKKRKKKKNKGSPAIRASASNKTEDSSTFYYD